MRELKEAILDSRVSNVYQLNSKTLLLKLHKPDQPVFQLAFETGKRLHLTIYAMEKPLVPPAFCMALRKLLRNGFLTIIEQYEFERVIILSFKTKSGVLRLILELFGDGNIILVSEENKILHALTYKRMRDRNILRNETFTFAPPSGKNPFKIGKEELQKALKDSGDVEVVRAFARFLSIGGVYAEEVLLRAEVDKTKPCKALSNGDFDAIFDGLQSLLSHVSDCKLEPSIVLDETGGFVDVVPFRLRRYEDFTFKPYNSFNETLDEFYVRVSTVEKAAAAAGIEVNELKREAERLKRIVESQVKASDEAEAKAGKDKQIGDAIYAHIVELQTLLDRFLTNKKGSKEWNQIASEVLDHKKAGVKPWVFFESFDARGMVVYVFVDGLRFGLDLKKGLYENAGRFYERAKRSKQKLEGAKTALEETRKKLLEVEAKLREAETLERAKPTEAFGELAKRKIKRKEWFEKFRWFVSSDGFLVVAGRDAVSNEVLVKKYAETADVVFHADVVGAPFVIVKTGGKEPSEQCLHEAGEFAAAFSRGWREGFASVDVYWVKPEQLSKGGPSGEYVSRGAFVVCGKRNWIRNIPLKVAIGAVVEENDEVKFLGGPVNAVKAKAKAYVVIVPGDQSSKELFRHVLKGLTAKMPKELRDRVLRVSVEEVRGYFPYGRGRVFME